MKNYYKQLYAKKLNKLEEIDIFPEAHNLPKRIMKKQGNLNKGWKD